jgi:hypothetical protein
MNPFSAGSVKKAPQSRGMSGMLRRLAARRAMHVLTTGALLLAAHSPSYAATPDAWSTAPTSGNFSGINWTLGTTIPGPATGTAAPGDALFFGGSTITNLTNDDTGLSFAGLNFNPGAAAFTIGGSQLITSAGILDYSTSLETLNLALQFTGSHSLYAISGGTMVVNGVISGDVAATGISKVGLGTVTLTGANIYTGGRCERGNAQPGLHDGRRRHADDQHRLRYFRSPTRRRPPDRGRFERCQHAGLRQHRL